MDSDHEHNAHERSPIALSADIDLHDPSLYLNRELSWLEFNDRVLQLAEEQRVALLERVKFCAIYTTNLDEFYMVRVAGLRDQIDAGVEHPGQDGRSSPSKQSVSRRPRLSASWRIRAIVSEGLRPS